jgi:hypothetical protein
MPQYVAADHWPTVAEQAEFASEFWQPVKLRADEWSDPVAEWVVGSLVVRPRDVTRERPYRPPARKEVVDRPALTEPEPVPGVFVGDISFQLLRRSSPEFLAGYLELLAEAMAMDAQVKALNSVLAGY